ncbi:MAG: cis-Golgi t-SNARE syntaxin [Vezdaea aestivalis]|nr:MAG: cis-Golgi t-SNARE syntaxin [Vezdaea aestivalis]
MTTTSIQDRTSEFRSVLQHAKKRQAPRLGQRQKLLNDQQRREGSPVKRSDFARKTAEIGRGITGTMTKLERLAQLAKRKTLFDDRPVEISELTYIIKQDLSSLNSQISALQPRAPAEEGEHNKNVVVLLQGKLADVSVNFKDVLEVRSKNMQASRSRTENFVSAVSSGVDPGRTDSPLYTPSHTPQPPDLLNLNPQSDQQLLLMEEGPSNTYINARSEAIETIEKTIGELGSIFSQLAGMVTEQGEMIQRIDANTEDVVDNVQGAQRELMKYWNRVSGNRWLIAKMFGILMVFFLLWVLIAG